MLFLHTRTFVPRIPVALGALACAVCLALGPHAGATDFTNAVQPASLAQPQINLAISLTDGGPLQSGQTTDDLGNPATTINTQAYFDTGASGILLSTGTQTGFNLPLQTVGSTLVTYQDVGAVGTALFNVSNPIYLSLAPMNGVVDVEDPTSYTQLSGSFRAQVGPVAQSSSDSLQNLINELLQGDINVVGTPAMAGKVVVIDPRGINSLAKNTTDLNGTLNDIITNLFFGTPSQQAAALVQFNQFNDQLTLHTYVYAHGTSFNSLTPDTNPGIPSTNRHIKLTYASFDQFTVTSSGGTPPALSHNPFIGPNPISAIDSSVPAGDAPKVKVGFNSLTTEGSFLLDTGAAASMISTKLAGQLDVRYATNADGTQKTNTDGNPYLETFDTATSTWETLANQFVLQIGGIGNSGPQNVAGFFLDSLLLRTNERTSEDDNDPNNLRFLGAPVLVDDITVTNSAGKSLTLDGVLGMNFFSATSSVDSSGGFGLGFDNPLPGQFDWMTIDFDETNPVLGLQLSVQSVPEPSTAILALFGACLGAVSLRRRIWPRG